MTILFDNRRRLHCIHSPASSSSMTTTSRKREADYTSVGETSKKIQKEVETIKIVIDDFKDRKEKRGEMIVSRILRAHGHMWRIYVYPRGCNYSSKHTEYVSFCLILLGRGTFKAHLTLHCNGFMWHPHQFVNDIMNGGWGKIDFLEREDVIQNYLKDNGSLVFALDIRIASEDRGVWYPQELKKQDLWVCLYHDTSKETTDVIFSVEGNIYPVHKSILYLCCKNLYERAKLYKGSFDNPIIPIDSVRGEIFESILEFIYTVKVPRIQDINVAIEILIASDRFECVHLKLFVESILVDKFLNAGNAAELLILADSHSCALLKEAATHWFLAHSDSVIKSEGWSWICESNVLLTELLDARMRYNKFEEAASIGCLNSWIDRLDVTNLRTRLQSANLELDGSRETLVSRYKTHLKQK